MSNTHHTPATAELIERLSELAEKATPGPWQSEQMKADDYNTFCVIDSKGRAVVDALNADYRISEIHTEYDEDGATLWDEPSRCNIEYIAACDPQTIKALCAAAKLGLDAKENAK